MRRERKEILNKMYEVEMQAEVDRQLGCGYTARDFGLEDPFEKAYDELVEELAATYGMTAYEYQMREMEIGSKLVDAMFYG